VKKWSSFPWPVRLASSENPNEQRIPLCRFRNSYCGTGSSETPFPVRAARGRWSMFREDAPETEFGNQRKRIVGCTAHNWQKWHEGPGGALGDSDRRSCSFATLRGRSGTRATRAQPGRGADRAGREDQGAPRACPRVTPPTSMNAVRRRWGAVDGYCGRSAPSWTANEGRGARALAGGGVRKAFHPGRGRVRRRQGRHSGTHSQRGLEPALRTRSRRRCSRTPPYTKLRYSGL
jgi:hypothetical protein